LVIDARASADSIAITRAASAPAASTSSPSSRNIRPMWARYSSRIRTDAVS
jgi:hypothetical protein